MEDKFGASSSTFLATSGHQKDKKDNRPSVMNEGGKNEPNTYSLEVPPYLVGNNVANSQHNSGHDTDMSDAINEKTISSYDQVQFCFASK